MSKPFVAILMGSDSDFEVMKRCGDALDELGIPWEMRVASAHRTPERVRDYVADASSRGAAVFVAAAGMAAHLAGVVAAETVKPIIAVPLASGVLDGLDALLSSVQMPPGALTDEFGNPMLPYSGSYILDFGTVAFPTPLGPRAP